MLPVISAAVTVMVLSPVARGMLDISQFAPLSVAAPDAEVERAQVIAGVPLPPVTLPESETVARVVVAAAAFMVSASGAGAGAGAVPVRAAYRVRIACLSSSARVETIL